MSVRLSLKYIDISSLGTMTSLWTPNMWHLMSFILVIWHNNIITWDQECPISLEIGTQKYSFIFLKVMSYSMAIPLTSYFN